MICSFVTWNMSTMRFTGTVRHLDVQVLLDYQVSKSIRSFDEITLQSYVLEAIGQWLGLTTDIELARGDNLEIVDPDLFDFIVEQIDDTFVGLIDIIAIRVFLPYDVYWFEGVIDNISVKAEILYQGNKPDITLPVLLGYGKKPENTDINAGIVYQKGYQRGQPRKYFAELDSNIIVKTIWLHPATKEVIDDIYQKHIDDYLNDFSYGFLALLLGFFFADFYKKSLETALRKARLDHRLDVCYYVSSTYDAQFFGKIFLDILMTTYVLTIVKEFPMISYLSTAICLALFGIIPAMLAVLIDWV